MTLEICVVAKAWSVGQDLGGFLLDEINHFHNNKKPVFSTKKVYSIIIILIRPVSTRLVSVWGLKNSVDFDMRYDYNFINRLILTRLHCWDSNSLLQKYTAWESTALAHPVLEN